ncbi:sugar ABC transporter permease [Phytohabitans flavus]|uniref:Sugar ABC transporter permease n=2 Tax=Phytohabitans flavus TaxID=1076124 RepID=A0A6F8XN66_9ACTN|nr:sugar ABC transporter permease [Phytohabitans flavus]
MGRYAFPAPALIYLLVFMVYPILYTFYLSFRGANAVNFLSGTAPFVGLDNYRAVLSSPTFVRTLVITLTFTICSLAFQHVIGFALALFFNREFPFVRLFRALLLLGWMLPAVVNASLWRWMFSGSFGVVNSLLETVGLGGLQHDWLTDPNTALGAVIVADVWVGIPFHMLLLHAGLQSLPGSVYEAARIDGASAWRQFTSITVPLMRPIMFTALLLGFVQTFKSFDIIYVMTGGGPAGATTVLPVSVYNLSFDYFQFGQGAAAANILLVIPLLLSIVYLWNRRREDAA